MGEEYRGGRAKGEKKASGRRGLEREEGKRNYVRDAMDRDGKKREDLSK